MKVLVSAASKHGATAEIADAIGEALREELEGLGDEDAVVDVIPPERVSSVESYDAVVLGSAVYMGRWLEGARELVAERSAGALGERPVWLFSSGPVVDPPRPSEGDSVDVDEILEATGARDHRVFAGRLDKSALGFAEKAVMVAVRASEGDFRDREEIREWSREIAAALQAPAT